MKKLTAVILLLFIMTGSTKLNAQLFWEDGLHRDYYLSGKLKIEYHTKNGQYHGMLKRYYENGQLKFVSDFKNGKNIGLWKKYYESGALQGICNTQELERGETRKDYQEFDEQGNLKKEFYEIFIKQGDRKTLVKKYENNRLSNEKVWKDGRTISEKNY